jgi:hypothetical protein
MRNPLFPVNVKEKLELEISPLQKEDLSGMFRAKKKKKIIETFAVNSITSMWRCHGEIISKLKSKSLNNHLLPL